VPKAKTAVPKAKTAVPKAKTAVPKAKTAVPKAKALASNDDIDNDMSDFIMLQRETIHLLGDI
jgi:hypothetical protein